MATTPVPMSYGEAEAIDAEAAAENEERDEREYEPLQTVIPSSTATPAWSSSSFHINGSRATFDLRPCLDVHMLQVTGGTGNFSIFAGAGHLVALRDALDEYLGDSHRVHVVVVDKGSV